MQDSLQVHRPDAATIMSATWLEGSVIQKIDLEIYLKGKIVTCPSGVSAGHIIPHCELCN